MKRVLICCLIVSILMGNSVIIAHENDYSGTKYEISSKVLNAFNIVSFDEDGNLNVGSKVSRAEFTVMIAKALGVDLNHVDGNAKYSDLDSGTQTTNAVVAVTKLGIVSGYGDGTFRPHDSITYAQAASMLDKMIGYKMFAESKGGFPSGYMTVASETGILKGISITDDAVNKADAVLMLYNAMCADMAKQIKFGSKEEYKIQKDVNIFTEYHGVSKSKGVVTDNGKTSLTGNSRISSDEVMIGGEIYKALNSGVENYLGYFVEFFVSNDDDKRVVIAYVLDSQNEILTINAKDIIKTNNPLTDGYMSYSKNETNTDKIHISKEFDVIYNGRAFPEFNASDLLIDAGKLIFLDNNRDATADILFIETYQNIVVAGADKELRKIYSMDNSVFEIDKDAEYEFFTTKGEKIDISDIVSDCVVSIFESRNKQYVKGIVNTQAVSGIVKEISSSENIFITVDEKTYVSSKSLENFNFSVGDAVVLYLDFNGEVAFVDKSASSNLSEYTYGYLINAVVENGLSENAKFRVFTKNGTFINFNGAKNIQLNGNTMNLQGKKYTPKSILEAYDFKENGRFKPQLIKYKLNGLSEIQDIHTAIVNDSNLGFNTEKFTMDYSATTVYRDIPKMFGSSYVINNDTILFNIPKIKDGEVNEDDCFVLTLSRFEGNTLYPVTLYDSSASRIASVLVTSHFSAEEFSRWGFIVEKVVTALNNDDEKVTKLYGYMNGKKSEYIFSKSEISSSNIKPGDILQLMLNKKDQVVAYNYLFDYTKEQFPSKMSANPGGILVGVYGKVLSKEKGSMTVMVEDNKIYPFVFSTYTRVYYIDYKNPSNIIVGTASSDDIIQSGKNYENIGIDTMAGSKVYINRRYDNAYDIVIIKD